MQLLNQQHSLQLKYVQAYKEKAVTFVDNHDTEIGQALESWILDWFKPLAYALILLRKDSMPCVFYGDYYGIPEKEVPAKNEILDILLKVRKYCAYGEQHDYFYDRNKIGFTRLGDYDHPDSGLAVVMSDGDGGCIQMNVGKRLANTVFYDITGNLSETRIRLAAFLGKSYLLNYQIMRAVLKGIILVIMDMISGLTIG